MKKNRKIIVLAMVALLCVSMCAFFDIDFGVVVENDNGEVMVYKEIAIDKNGMNELDFTDAVKVSADAMSNNDWDSEAIDRHEDGVHLVGTRFEKEISSGQMIDTYIEIAALFDSAYSYDMKSTIGSKTVTVNIKPSKQQLYQAAQELMGYGKDPDDKYTFSIVTPGKISYTNGTVLSDGKTVRWDIKDLILNEESTELVVKYKDNSAYPFIFGGIALVIGIIVFIIVRRKKTVRFEEGSIYSAPVNTPLNEPANNSLTDEVNDMYDNEFDARFGSRFGSEPVNEQVKDFGYGSVSDSVNMAPKSQVGGKCPNCGGPLTDDGMFCENCGTFV